MASELFARLTKNLVAREPMPKGPRYAAVSIIVRDRQSPCVLLIKRAERPGDPWSGQIAFPGGKTQPGDRTVRATAVRETLEEVGIDLERAAEFLGYGSPATTHTGSMDVVPSVFALKEGVEARPNEEVASFRWVDLADLLAPEAETTYTVQYDGNSVGVPAFAVGDYIVWGLTHRILSSLLKDS